MSVAVATMRAARVAAPQEASVEAVPVPEPAPGQVLVRVEGCGVCGSSLPVWEGRPWFDYPLPPGAPGHEGWGTVERAAGGLAEGERVAFLSRGAFAELDVADEGACVPLPPELEGRPVPGEPLGCAVNAFRRSDVRPGMRVAVVGVGFLGALLVQLCVDAGARVLGVSRRASSRALARELGAEESAALDEVSGVECDRAIEAAGVQATLDVASALVRERGRLVIAGFHQDGPREVDLQSWNWRGLDVVNAHERDPAVYAAGMREAVRLVAQGRLDPDRLYTHGVPLERAGEAFELSRTRPHGFVKALVLV